MSLADWIVILLGSGLLWRAIPFFQRKYEARKRKIQEIRSYIVVGQKWLNGMPEFLKENWGKSPVSNYPTNFPELNLAYPEISELHELFKGAMNFYIQFGQSQGRLGLDISECLNDFSTFRTEFENLLATKKLERCLK